MLSESHPTYLQNLRMHLLRTRNKLDYDMFILAIVAVVILPQEMIIGMCTFRIVRVSNQVIQ
jgi:magnesium transporter